jgi:biopolymer transport protein ExbD
MRFPRNRQIFRGQLDVAAFASVLFLLLIFILLRSQLVFTPGVPIRLIEADDMPGVIGRSVVVAVDSSGQYYFDNQLIHERLLKQQLKVKVEESREPLILIIQGDKSVNLEQLVRVGELGYKAGIREAFIASRPALGSKRTAPAP